MRVINYFDSDRQSHWINEIKRGDWGAAGFLYELLSKGSFFDTAGENSKVIYVKALWFSDISTENNRSASRESLEEYRS